MNKYLEKIAAFSLSQGLEETQRALLLARIEFLKKALQRKLG